MADIAVARAVKDLPNPVWADAGSPMARSAGTIRLAVLPFETTRRQWRKPAAMLRAAMAASLQDSPFHVVELQQVDAALKELGWREGEPLPETLPQLAQRLGADALLRGTVTTWGRTYLIVESWVKAGLALELLNGGTAAVIWSDRRINRRQAGLLKGPTGFTSIATAPVMGLRRKNLEQVATHLTRDLANALSESPAVLAYVHERSR